MHPYFVKFPSDPILGVKVVTAISSVTWTFFLQRRDGIGDMEFESINNIFTLLDLGDLYRDAAVEEIMDRIGSIDEQYTEGGAAEVRRYLQMEADSARMRRGVNHWKTAILQALADDDDFCDGGYRRLAGG